MSVRTERVDETKKNDGLHELNQMVVTIGSKSRNLSKLLARAVGGGSTADYKFNLRTKYYKNSVTPSCFAMLSQFIGWKDRTANPDDIFIGALFVILENASDQILNELYAHKLTLADVQIQSKAIVINKEGDLDPNSEEKCIEWCNINGFEIVYLENSEASMNEARKNKEKLGEARLLELLQIVDWPIKTVITPRLTGHVRLDHVLNILEGMSDSEEEDDYMPKEEELAGIYEFLGVSSSSSDKNGTHNKSGSVAEANVNVNVNVALKGGVISSVSVNSEADGGKKGKGNKGKAGKGNGGKGKLEKEDGSGQSSVEAEVTLPMKVSPREGKPHVPIAEKGEEAEDSLSLEEKKFESNVGLFNHIRSLRSLNKTNGWEEGEMRVGGALGMMDMVCRDLLGEEGLAEEVMKIEKLKREGKYVESEDSD